MIKYHLKKENIRYFIKIISSISQQLPESNLIFGNGIRIFGLDPSRIYLFDSIIGDDFFTIEKDMEAIVGINLGDFSKILNKCIKSDNITLEYDEKQRIIKIIKEEKDKTSTFKLREEEIEQSEEPDIDIMSIPYDSVFETTTTVLLNVIKDALIYDPVSMNINVKNGRIYTSAESIKGGVDIVADFDFIISNNCQCCFSIIMLENILEMIPEENITILLKTGYPIIINKVKSDKTYFRILLAPRTDKSEMEEDYD